MKRKLAAAVIAAAMAAGALPGSVLAAPAENIQETETYDMTGVSESEEKPESQDALETAIARGGEIDLTGRRIELTRQLYVNNNVRIKGGTLVGTDSVTGNLVTLTGDEITLDGVTIQTAPANKSALHVYGTNLTVNGLAIDHSSAAGGAPIIINNGADAVFSGSIDLTLGGSSWYGINVDSAQADFSAAVLNVTPVTDTQSVICMEGNTAEVSGVSLTVVTTEKDGGGSNRQTAYVADSNLAQFVAAKTAAGKDISQIELHKNVALTAPLVLSEPMTVSGARDGVAILGSDAVGRDNVVTVTADGVVLKRLTIRTTAANKSALHIYRADASLDNVTLDNTETAGGAGMIVNGGTARITGALTLLLGGNSWGGINVDTTNGNAGVVFENGSVVNMTGDGHDAVYVDEDDKNNGNTVTITGAEQAGLVQDADGNYVAAGTAETPKPEQPGGEEDGGGADGGTDGDGSSLENSGSGAEGAAEKESEKENTAAPQTGDTDGVPYVLLAALAGSGAAAGAVLKKKKGIRV